MSLHPQDMTFLELSANQGISGTIPSSFSVMHKLKDFRLNRNNLLSGTLSDDIIQVHV